MKRKKQLIMAIQSSAKVYGSPSNAERGTGKMQAMFATGDAYTELRWWLTCRLNFDHVTLHDIYRTMCKRLFHFAKKKMIDLRLDLCFVWWNNEGREYDEGSCRAGSHMLRKRCWGACGDAHPSRVVLH
ncbi:Hypothetical protein, putative [Bodo saltans]|uniref:Uncharacterized protein n=1 Tax=Bodo saltans TaxID=75058 RepID=A0A0S4IH68_BODSA|nr:Hypothetical protein, putative [Bodo saltans]|eukprot:CUE59645.1 Hypothetical protein, putative [Bodo saltans]